MKSYGDPTIPDFPSRMVPFRDDPRYGALEPVFRQRVLAAAWVAYNEKTIAVEKAIVAPACDLLLEGAFHCTDAAATKRAVAQTLVDEHYHVLMCLDACIATRELHGLSSLRIPKPVVVHELERAIDASGDAREAEITRLAFAIVAETTINAYLDLLANDASIQPINRDTTALHRRDESSHAKLFKEFARGLFGALTERERRVFVRALGAGLGAFVKVDFGAWGAILTHLAVAGAGTLLDGCSGPGKPQRVFRDFSGFRLLLRDLSVPESAVPFEFDAP